MKSSRLTYPVARPLSGAPTPTSTAPNPIAFFIPSLSPTYPPINAPTTIIATRTEKSRPPSVNVNESSPIIGVSRGDTVRIAKRVKKPTAAAKPNVIHAARGVFEACWPDMPELYLPNYREGAKNFLQQPQELRLSFIKESRFLSARRM